MVVLRRTTFTGSLFFPGGWGPSGVGRSHTACLSRPVRFLLCSRAWFYMRSQTSLKGP